MVGFTRSHDINMIIISDLSYRMCQKEHWVTHKMWWVFPDHIMIIIFDFSYRMCQKEHWVTHKVTCKRRPEPVGSPFVISLPKSHATYARLCQTMEAYAR